MVRSAFTFYRGAALTMAADLASTPSTGLRVQCCGDAHLCNFGGFATPERRVIFSINDLDETLPAPWEWDVKRLAASFVVACRDLGLSEAVARDVVLNSVRTYRESMAEFSQLKTLELWYRAVTAEELMEGLPPKLRTRIVKRIEKEQAKSRGEEMFPKLVEQKGDIPVIKDQLPTIFHAEGHPPGEVPSLAEIHVLVVDDDDDTLDALRHLLEQAGARVSTAGSAAAAFRSLEGEPPDVLLSDIGMPGEDGLSLIRRVRGLDPARGGRVPAAARTAYTQPADRDRAFSAGFQAFLAKPIDPRELAAAVARLAGRTA
jgi:CheY-like chemotaxis protein